MIISEGWKIFDQKRNVSYTREEMDGEMFLTWSLVTDFTEESYNCNFGAYIYLAEIKCVVYDFRKHVPFSKALSDKLQNTEKS